MKSTDNTGTAGFLYACISSRVMEQAVQQGIDAGVKAAMDYIEAERKKGPEGASGQAAPQHPPPPEELPTFQAAHQGGNLPSPPSKGTRP